MTMELITRGREPKKVKVANSEMVSPTAAGGKTSETLAPGTRVGLKSVAEPSCQALLPVATRLSGGEQRAREGTKRELGCLKWPSSRSLVAAPLPPHKAFTAWPSSRSAFPFQLLPARQRQLFLVELSRAKTGVQ